MTKENCQQRYTRSKEQHPDQANSDSTLNAPVPDGALKLSNVARRCVDQANGQSVRTCPDHGDSSVKSKSLLVKRRSQAQVLCANFSSVGQGSLVGT
ncbi:hypothetical protein M8J77_003529 [Diaphorina citri]|nr:hypothetical protein M8J77_003529 [Diaphorina citri]